MPEYQVFHQQAVKSFSAGEDNEHLIKSKALSKVLLAATLIAKILI